MSTKESITEIRIAERKKILKAHRGLLAQAVRELSLMKKIGLTAVSAAYWRRKGERSASPRAEALLLKRIREIQAADRLAIEAQHQTESVA
jgi:hypothetical protein